MTRFPLSALVATAGALALLAGCGPRQQSDRQIDLADLGRRYAAAWSSQSPDSLAAFYAEDGFLAVNQGTPAVGRAAIRTKVESFMAGFPDMVVRMDSMARRGNRVVFHWTWTGTNTGPGGTGRPVNLSGYEEWTLGPDNLIESSRGHYDEAEYEHQVSADP